jgi:hypothetical protein
MTAATTAEPERDSVDAFTLIGLTGILFAVLGGTDLATQLFPLGLGSPEWEFGTYSSMMDSIPLFAMGLGFLGVYAIARANRALSISVGILFILVALFILAFAFIYATNLPQVLRVRPRSPAQIALQTGVKKAVVKGTLQSAIYPIAFLWMGIFALRHSGRKSRR